MTTSSKRKRGYVTGLKKTAATATVAGAIVMGVLTAAPASATTPSTAMLSSGYATIDFCDDPKWRILRLTAGGGLALGGLTAAFTGVATGPGVATMNAGWYLLDGAGCMFSDGDYVAPPAGEPFDGPPPSLMPEPDPDWTSSSGSTGTTPSPQPGPPPVAP